VKAFKTSSVTQNIFYLAYLDIGEHTKLM